MIEKVYKVYGDNLPDRILYNATVASPVTVRAILKKYKSWAKFEQAYVGHCILERNKLTAKKVVTKKVLK